jgi:hypothetical protein
MSRITNCPNCSTRLRVSEQITDKTMICPHCLADVDNPQPGFQIRAADINTDVKRDLHRGCLVLAAFIGLCVLGLSGLFGSHLFKAERFFLMIFSFAALDVLVSIAIIVRLVRWGISKSPNRSVARMAGMVLGIIFLLFGTLSAMVVFFFFSCLLS